MRSKPVAALLVDLDIPKSHSRPHVSDDNPYPESAPRAAHRRLDQLATIRENRTGEGQPLRR